MDRKGATALRKQLEEIQDKMLWCQSEYERVNQLCAEKQRLVERQQEALNAMQMELEQRAFQEKTLMGQLQEQSRISKKALR